MMQRLWLHVNGLIRSRIFLLPTSFIDEKPSQLLVRLHPKHGIDLVFLDYNMPGFSGIETLAEIKRVKRRVDVVVMTSADDESLAGRAREYGAAFLKKPFYPADIEAVLCQFYGLRALNPKRA